MENEQARQLAALAADAERRPAFLASTFAAYRRLDQVDDAALARELGLDAEGLARLALCRRPREEEGLFREDLTRIARFSGCDAAVLARIVREAEFAARAGLANAGGRASLLAAQDRMDDAADSEPAPDTPPDAGPER